MPSISPQLKVNPEILRWARETIGYDLSVASKKISVKPEVLKNWERTESAISIPRLRNIANVYKRSLGLFLLADVPRIAAFPPDFRTLDSTRTEGLSPDVRLAIRKAERNREFYVELNEVLEEEVPNISKIFSLLENPEELAADFREYINVSLGDQAKWGDKGEALKGWISSIENIGILVFQMPMPISELRAFCLRGNSLPPAIVLNTKDDIHGRIFSLFHELSHLLIRSEDLEELNLKEGISGAHRYVEAFANQFSGNFLVPTDSLLSNPFTENYLASKSEYSFQRLKGIYKVSGEVILRRLLDLGKISNGEYKERVKEIRKKVEEYKKKQEAKRKDKSGFKNVSLESFQRSGPLLASKAFTAGEQGKISTADIASFYEIKQSHLKKIKGYLDSFSKT